MKKLLGIVVLGLIFCSKTYADHQADHWINLICNYSDGSGNIEIKFDKNNFKEVKYAIVWNLPNHILKQLKNLKIIFSMGAGVDHILKLQSYTNIPIIRLKVPEMRARMANHVLSQILKFQLNLSVYSKGQLKKKWIDEIDSFEPLDNQQLTVGILGAGFLGSYVANYLKKINYNIIGFKRKKTNKKFGFRRYYSFHTTFNK